MVYTLKSLEFMQGVEPFRVEEQGAELKEEEETQMISAETDAGMSLMLEWKMRLSEDSDMCTTCNCPVDFGDRAVILEHYQSLFHRTNTLRKAKNQPVYTEEDFEGTEKDEHDLSTTHAIIGLESDDEEFDALLLPANRSFFVKDEHVFSVPRNILHIDESEVSSTTFLRPFDCAIFLWNGGHFAAAMFENDRMTVQKSFHRYVARAKQGGVQSQHDSGGKGAAKSAGAQLRRYNEQKMKEEIQQIMSSWKPRLQKTPLLFIRCAAYHRNVFFDADAGIESRDTRIRTIPFETKRPNIEEIEETWRRLQHVSEHGTSSEFKEEMREVREKRKRLARKVAGKKRKDGGMQMICEWSEDEDGENQGKREKRMHHIKVRTIRKSEDIPVQWPQLDDEWRQKTYNLVRQDDVDSLKQHIQNLNEDVIPDAIDYLKTAKIPPNRSTFLHVSAASGSKKCLKYLLDDIRCDSGAKDGAGLPPYSSCSNSEIKSIFIDYRVENESVGNWGRTHIPEPKKKVELTEEQEKEQAERKKEKKMRQKEKEKTKKEEVRKEAEEAAEREKYVKMSEREKRAMAVDRRLAGLPPVMRCHQCGTLLPPTPFQYSHFNFCTTSCVAEHRKANP
ncbi:hypothetical protein GCK72_008282 [Caenorhabditis remanei]|uniref:VLRF1 domain-containing protein n=1 Tax=Caenorhabditis remanei TaxID=31234 RepID=A0A6A5GZU4_CAERE|nr:hypothetical protein GCK72_008282 [Caenorhabditis remanei]KAF1760036.1 hypothetical protein GCK72_008282 [Caenorhabditis remanei]